MENEDIKQIMAEKNARMQNAIIENTMLGYEDHGIMSSYLHLRFPPGGQGFGGYGLDGPYDKVKKKRLPNRICGYWIQRVIETVGVDKWEDLPRKHVRIVHTHSKIYALGNIIEDKWFIPEIELRDFY